MLLTNVIVHPSMIAFLAPKKPHSTEALSLHRMLGVAYSRAFICLGNTASECMSQRM